MNEDEVLVETNENDYIEEIQNLRANTVSKEDYEKLRLENKRLISSLARGETTVQPVEEKPDLNTLRKKVFDNPHQSNLEYIQNALNLRNAVLEQEGYDCFAPHSTQTPVDKDDEKTAAKVAQVMQEAIDYAEGDSQLFTNELQRRTIDVSIPRRK